MNYRNSTKYIVTDGETVMGIFRTKRGVDSYLKAAKLRDLAGNWKSLPESGFFIRLEQGMSDPELLQYALAHSPAKDLP